MTGEAKPKGWLRRNGVLALLAAGAIATGAAYGGAVASNAEAEAAAKAEVAESKRLVGEAQAAVAEAIEAGTYDGFGVSMDRVAQDQGTINDLLGAALTWDSHDSYLDAREALVEDWGVALDSQFMQTFLPDPPGRQDSEGTFHSLIDAQGLNSKYGGSEARVQGVDGEGYVYLVEARMSAKSSDGASSATSHVVVQVTVLPDGKVKDLRGYVASGDTKSSRD